MFIDWQLIVFFCLFFAVGYGVSFWIHVYSPSAQKAAQNLEKMEERGDRLRKKVDAAIYGE